MKDIIPNKDRISELWEAIKNYVDEKESDVTFGDTLVENDKVVDVADPVQSIISQEDFDRLPEKERNRGIYFILGEGGGIGLNANKIDFDGKKSGIEADTVQGAIEELFTSVSDGKRKIAVAITDKGVATEASATFDEIAQNISEIESGMPDDLFEIKLSANPHDAGTVIGGGYASMDMECVVKAFDNGETTFTGWQENGEDVSIEPIYQFSVDRSRNLTANFYKYIAGKDWFLAEKLPVSSYWRTVTYGNGKFVAIGYSSNKAIYSEDGITWTLANELPSSTAWKSIVYGNGKFVTATNAGSAYSIDGITWTLGNAIPSSTPVDCITYGNGKFVVMGRNSLASAYSADGITWTRVLLTTNAQWWDIAYGSGKFVIMATSGNLNYSTNGTNWTFANIGGLPSGGTWESITYGDGKFVAVPRNSKSIAYSEDGITWTIADSLPVVANWIDITYGGGKFVAIANNSNYTAYSTDGITWALGNDTPTTDSTSWYSVAYGNGKFVAVADNSQYASYSMTTNNPPT